MCLYSSKTRRLTLTPQCGDIKKLETLEKSSVLEDSAIMNGVSDLVHEGAMTRWHLWNRAQALARSSPAAGMVSSKILSFVNYQVLGGFGIAAQTETSRYTTIACLEDRKEWHRLCQLTSKRCIPRGTWPWVLCEIKV